MWPRRQAAQPIASAVGEQGINLPSGVRLRRDEIDRVRGESVRRALGPRRGERRDPARPADLPAGSGCASAAAPARTCWSRCPVKDGERFLRERVSRACSRRRAPRRRCAPRRIGAGGRERAPRLPPVGRGGGAHRARPARPPRRPARANARRHRPPAARVRPPAGRRRGRAADPGAAGVGRGAARGADAGLWPAPSRCRPRSSARSCARAWRAWHPGARPTWPRPKGWASPAFVYDLPDCFDRPRDRERWETLDCPGTLPG